MRGSYVGPPAVEARPLKTPIGTSFLVDPAFDSVIAQAIADTRSEVQNLRATSTIVTYISTPLSPRGGGYRPINAEISAFVKRRLEQMYGPRYAALSPTEQRRDLPDVDGRPAGGGEYLYMWSLILAGDDGLGRDFDVVYFVGPADVAAYFGLGDRYRLEQLYQLGNERAQVDAAFRTQVWDSPATRDGFVRFYGGRASVAFSLGAHDEWNLFAMVNQNRLKSMDFGLGAQVAMYFDGRAVSPGDMNARALPGYEIVAP